MIRFILAIKNLILSIVIRIAKLLFYFFKFFLYKPFITLYYLIFRIKKYEIAGQEKYLFFTKKIAHFFILLLIISSLFLNLQGNSASAANRMNKSFIAQVVKNEYILSHDDELIVEDSLASLNLELAGADKYLKNNSPFNATKLASLAYENELDDTARLVLDKDGALLKPKGASLEDEISSSLSSLNKEQKDTQIKARTEIVSYTVKSGDTISAIAQSFGLKVNTILWANDLGSFSIIRAGDELKILPSNGFLYKVKSGDTLNKLAQDYKVELSEILETNTLNEKSSIVIGQELIIPGQKPVQSSVVASSQGSYTGINVIKDIIIPDNAPVANVSGFLWPTPGRRITQYFSLRHNGLDIGDKIGTPIYAAESGTVEKSLSGYNGGYGLYVLLDHGNGVKTRYAHASQLLVSTGEKVEKGQVIALIGSTGRSTGPHLHFEILISGVARNPLDYIK